MIKNKFEYRSNIKKQSSYFKIANLINICRVIDDGRTTYWKGLPLPFSPGSVPDLSCRATAGVLGNAAFPVFFSKSKCSQKNLALSSALGKAEEKSEIIQSKQNNV